jgi:3'(2'), 5'-bisphosphate nucleotidase
MRYPQGFERFRPAIARFDKRGAQCYNLLRRAVQRIRRKEPVLTAQDLQRELDVAVRLARQAGAAIMDYYREGVEVDYKPGDEPVTVADEAADRIISGGLRAAFPDDGLLSEESEDDPARLDKERVWIVDPLDGTTEFIGETDEFAVQIALTVHGRPVLGVVYQPVQELLLYARQGHDAYQEQDGLRTRLHVSAEPDPQRMCLVASRSHFSDLVGAAQQVLGIQRVERVGSVGHKVGLLARGHCDLYLATRVCKEWDLCAPHALLEGAGGLLTDLYGDAIVYNKPEVSECRGLVGSNGLAHARIVGSIAPLVDRLSW